MSASTDFDTMLSDIRARILELTGSPNPDVTVGGRTISKAAYLATLTEQYDKLLKLQQTDNNGGAWNVISYGV